MTKVVVITGASSGIGSFTAKALCEKGCTVYDLSRRNISQEGIIHIKTDVTDEENVTQSIKQIVENEGRIDVVINCAGYGISGAVEFTELESAKISSMSTFSVW